MHKLVELEEQRINTIHYSTQLGLNSTYAKKLVKFRRRLHGHTQSNSMIILTYLKY